MRLNRALGLCLAGFLLVGAIASANAFASEPAFYECGKAAKERVEFEGKVHRVYTGKYIDTKCSEEAPEGKYRAGGAPEGEYEFREWSLAAKKGKVKKFKSVGKPPATLEIPHVTTVECPHSSAEGEVSGPQTIGALRETLTGCKASSIPCENGELGEITTNPLRGEIGYVSLAKRRIGIDLRPESGAVFVELHCGVEPEPVLLLRTTGSLVGEIGPVNAYTKELTINFEQVSGKQVLKELEGFTEPDFLLTAYCKSKEPCEPQEPTESGHSAKLTLRGEELYLKAFAEPYEP